MRVTFSFFYGYSAPRKEEDTFIARNILYKLQVGQFSLNSLAIQWRSWVVFRCFSLDGRHGCDAMAVRFTTTRVHISHVQPDFCLGTGTVVIVIV